MPLMCHLAIFFLTVMGNQWMCTIKDTQVNTLAVILCKCGGVGCAIRLHV